MLEILETTHSSSLGSWNYWKTTNSKNLGPLKCRCALDVWTYTLGVWIRIAVPWVSELTSLHRCLASFLSSVRGGSYDNINFNRFLSIAIDVPSSCDFAISGRIVKHYLKIYFGRSLPLISCSAVPHWISRSTIYQSTAYKWTSRSISFRQRVQILTRRSIISCSATYYWTSRSRKEKVSAFARTSIYNMDLKVINRMSYNHFPKPTPQATPLCCEDSYWNSV